VGYSRYAQRKILTLCEGQEQYHSLVPLYFRKAAAVIVVYDITRSQTFDEAKRWIKEITGAPEDVILVLTGSKSDLSNLRQVETRTGSNYAKEIGALFIETSSKSATNVEQLFELIGKKYVARMNGVVDDEPDLDTGVTISSHMETAPRTGCC
jgi:GTPase SAR1 family protein